MQNSAYQKEGKAHQPSAAIEKKEELNQVNPMQTTQTQITLNVKESLTQFRSHQFKIMDMNGHILYRFHSRMVGFMSLHKELLGSDGRPCVTFEKSGQWMWFGTQWSAYRNSSNSKMFTAESNFAPFTNLKDINIYLSGNAREPDYKMQGIWAQKDFKIIDVRNQRIIAQCSRNLDYEMDCCLLQCFAHMGDYRTDVNNYQITIEPGVDMSFVASICCIFGETFLRLQTYDD